MNPAKREAELIHAARRGDEASLAALLAMHDGTLRRYARRWLPPQLRRKVSVSDVLQEAHIVAARRIVEFDRRGDTAFRNWLLKILEYKVRDELKRYRGAAKRSVHSEITRGARDATGEMRARQETPSQIAIASELARTASTALQRLPANYREVLTLAREQELTLREIGERIGKSREATKKLYSRALARFTGEFERLTGGEDGS